MTTSNSINPNLYAGHLLGRAIANAIDSMIVWVPVALLFPMTTETKQALHDGKPFLIAWGPIFMFLGGSFLYQAILYKFKSATIGKLVLRLQVVDVGSQKAELNWKQALIRAACQVVFSIALFSLPAAFAFFRSDRRQASDLLAGTMVVSFTARETAPKKQIVPGILFIIGVLIALTSMYGPRKDGARPQVSDEGVIITPRKPYTFIKVEEEL